VHAAEGLPVGEHDIGGQADHRFPAAAVGDADAVAVGAGGELAGGLVRDDGGGAGLEDRWRRRGGGERADDRFASVGVDERVADVQRRGARQRAALVAAGDRRRGGGRGERRVRVVAVRERADAQQGVDEPRVALEK
jgi:hypothetical protein